MSKNISKLSSRVGMKNNLFDAQKSIANAKNPDQEKQALSKKSLIGVAALEGSSSFYDFIQGKNAGKKAYLCNGTSCLCAGKQEKVKQDLEQQFGADQVGHISCLGHCYEAAAFQISDNNYGGSDSRRMTELVESNVATNKIPSGVSLNQAVLLVETGDTMQWYQPLINAVSNGQAEQLLDRLIAASLKGRGGAGFPAGLKWKACKEQPAGKKYIVCNADEGDPGAFTDRYLLEHHPHSVLFGMMLAGYIAGADEGILYIRDEYPLAISYCQKAIDELAQLGLTGQNFPDSEFNFSFKIIRGAGSYVCGEETALLRSIEGQRPVVSIRPPFPVESGLFGQPTVLNNVETFACSHWIIENGGEQFVALGSKQSAGVKLLSLDQSFNKPGVYEVPMGTALSEVINNLGGGFRIPVKALQIGGPLGGIVPAEKFDQLSIDFESFGEAGFLLGHGSMVGIPQTMPILDFLAHLFEFTADESCGKCFPCRLGSTRGLEMIQTAQGGETIDRQLLDDLLETMELGSLCALGGGLPLPIKNALQYFSQELNDIFEQEAAQ